jgi:uncharacterized protein (TIGR02996 family)
MTTAAVTGRLAAALARWRRTGAREDAAAFEAQARAALSSWTPPVTTSAHAFQRAWLLAVHDEIGRGWAIKALVQQIPGADDFQRACALAKRVNALLRHGPDPRFAQVIRLIGRSDSAAGVPRLRLAIERLHAATVADTGPAIPVVIELPPATPQIDALWRDVHAHPEDDATLAVLADALQIAGDPRGELIALQLVAGGDDPARLERRKVLIASCGAAWLGRLTQVTGAASFERGCVRRLLLAGLLRASDPGWEALTAAPALATVTDLLRGDVSGNVYARFITSPAMRSLARIEVSDRIALAALARTPPSLTHVACELPLDPELIARLDRCGGLRSVAITAAGFDQLVAAPWFSRLTGVTLGGGSVRGSLARWAALPRPMTLTLTLVPSVRLPACATGFPWDFAITLVRAGDATIARISGEWLLLPLDVLSELPRDVVRVEVDHPSAAMVERVRGAIRRPALDIVHHPTPRVSAVFVPTQQDRRRTA